MMPAMHPVFERLGASRLVAVVMIDREEHAVPLAQALLAGGVSAMELTLRSKAALGSLRRVVEGVPGMLVGAGTVIAESQIEGVMAAGAAFGVAPGTNPRILAACRDAGLPFAPGIATPSDIESALEFDCRLLKFFPAGAMGGLDYLQGIAAPYRHLGIRYLPLGGVDEENLQRYVSAPDILAVGGSWLAPRPLLESEDWSGVESLARRAADLVAQEG